MLSLMRSWVSHSFGISWREWRIWSKNILFCRSYLPKVKALSHIFSKKEKKAECNRSFCLLSRKLQLLIPKSLAENTLLLGRKTSIARNFRSKIWNLKSCSPRSLPINRPSLPFPTAPSLISQKTSSMNSESRILDSSKKNKPWIVKPCKLS